MKIKSLAILSLVCVALAYTPVWAGPVGLQKSPTPDQAELALPQLKAEQQQVDRQLPEPPKGPALVRWFDKRSQLQDLISRIQSNQPVSPDQIDQALQPTYQ
jgi:hypothetical protein